MPITREEWHKLEPGDTLKLQGYAAGHATFVIATVESYQPTPTTTTVHTLRNKHHESVTFGHYQVQNPASYIIKKEQTHNG